MPMLQELDFFQLLLSRATKNAHAGRASLGG
jgi:hypothetical protein